MTPRGFPPPWSDLSLCDPFTFARQSECRALDIPATDVRPGAAHRLVAIRHQDVALRSRAV
jgi:hypothetical protein